VPLRVGDLQIAGAGCRLPGERQRGALAPIGSSDHTDGCNSDAWQNPLAPTRPAYLFMALGHAKRRCQETRCFALLTPWLLAVANAVRPPALLIPLSAPPILWEPPRIGAPGCNAWAKFDLEAAFGPTEAESKPVGFSIGAV